MSHTQSGSIFSLKNGVWLVDDVWKNQDRLWIENQLGDHVDNFSTYPHWIGITLTHIMFDVQQLYEEAVRYHAYQHTYD